MVQITNLAFGYPKKVPLFNGLNLDLQPGRIYGLLGMNGAGKSTLLRIMCGLQYAQTGGCTTLGFNAKSRHPDLLARIFFVPEDFWTPKVTIKEYADLYGPFYPKFNKNEYYQHLDDFGLKPGEKLNGVSYGQRKKCFLAFALAANSDLLILDEPTNGLDIPSKSMLRKKLIEQLGENRLIVVATHQVREMENLFDTILILDQGKVLFHQTVAEIGKKISFHIQHEVPDEKEVLYSQAILGGYSVAVKNELGDESPVDLEVLFNLLIGGKVDVKGLFAEEVGCEK